MPGMFAHQVSHGLPSRARLLMYRIHFIDPALAHKACEEIVRLVGIELLWFAHCIPEILHVLLQA